MYRKYYSYSDMPVPVINNPPKSLEETKKQENIKKPESKKRFQNDDLILIAVFLLLIMKMKNWKIYLFIEILF